MATNRPTSRPGVAREPPPASDWTSPKDKEEMRMLKITQDVTERVCVSVQRYIQDQLALMKNDILTAVRAEIATSARSAARSEVHAEISKIRRDATPADRTAERAIIPAQVENRIIAAATDRAAEKACIIVQKQIMREVIPKINNAIEWVNFQTEDGAQIVNDFRREVFENAREYDDNRGVSDAVRSRQNLRSGVQTFFSDAD